MKPKVKATAQTIIMLVFLLGFGIGIILSGVLFIWDGISKSGVISFWGIVKWIGLGIGFIGWGISLIIIAVTVLKAHNTDDLRGV
jgi:hypothetical protein